MISVELVEKEFLHENGEPTVIKQIKISDSEADYEIWYDPEQADGFINDLIDTVDRSGYYAELVAAEFFPEFTADTLETINNEK